MKKLPFLIQLICISICYSSCHKENSPETGTILPPVVNITFHLKGRITDETGTPVLGATIKSHGSQTVTDLSGNFLLSNVTAPETNAIVFVEKTGYFDGSRTFIPSTNNTHQVYIQLIKRDIYKTVDGSSGGAITFTSGIKLEFSDNSFVTSNGDVYGGLVSVYQTYLNPSDSNFFLQMPGDLRGFDSLHNLGVLHSFGMSNIELQTASGQSLQIAPGKKVKMTTTIQNTQQTIAPSVIPLWYWNDSSGFWKQEGSALRIGNTYSGYVSHFTTWNFDVINGYSYIKAKFVTAAGNPISYRRLQVTALDGPVQYTFSENVTTESGNINALAPIIIGSKISLLDDCGQVLYTKILSPLTSPLDLGTIIVSNAPNVLTIKGQVLDCVNNPLPNSTVYITMANRVEIVQPKSDGSFIFQALGCLSKTDFTVTAISNSTNEQNVPQNFSINNRDSVNVGNIIICKNSTDEFIQIIRNIDTFNYRYPECSTIFGSFTKPSTLIDSSRTNIFALKPSSNFYSGIILNHVPASFSPPGTMNIYSVNISNADSIPSYEPIYGAQQPVMNIIEYGSVGQYITGSFSGPLNRSGYSSLHYNFKINFRVKRTQ